jgi:hypothetical protein
VRRIEALRPLAESTEPRFQREGDGIMGHTKSLL